MSSSPSYPLPPGHPVPEHAVQAARELSRLLMRGLKFHRCLVIWDTNTWCEGSVPKPTEFYYTDATLQVNFVAAVRAHPGVPPAEKAIFRVSFGSADGHTTFSADDLIAAYDEGRVVV